MEKKDQYIVLSIQDANHFIKYLAARPYQEVFGLVEILKAADQERIAREQSQDKEDVK